MAHSSNEYMLNYMRKKRARELAQRFEIRNPGHLQNIERIISAMKTLVEEHSQLLKAIDAKGFDKITAVEEQQLKVFTEQHLLLNEMFKEEIKQPSHINIAVEGLEAPEPKPVSVTIHKDFTATVKLPDKKKVKLKW